MSSSTSSNSTASQLWSRFRPPKNAVARKKPPWQSSSSSLDSSLSHLETSFTSTSQAHSLLDPQISLPQPVDWRTYHNPPPHDPTNIGLSTCDDTFSWLLEASDDCNSYVDKQDFQDFAQPTLIAPDLTDGVVAPPSQLPLLSSSRVTPPISSVKSPTTSAESNTTLAEKRRLNTLAARRSRQRRLDQVTSLESELKQTQLERDALKARVARLEGETEVLRQVLRERDQLQRS